MNDFQKPQPQSKLRRDYSLVALIIVTIVSVYAVASEWDQHADEEDHQIDVQLARAAERGQLEREWSEKVARAYAQGQRDSLTSMKRRDRMSVAQTCQAWLHRDDAVLTGSAVAAQVSASSGG